MADKRANNRYNRIGGRIFRPRIFSRIFNSQIVLREIVVDNFKYSCVSIIVR